MQNNQIPQPEKILYTGKTHTTGGRQGASQSSDHNLNITLTPPGAIGTGTNPEQLFAAGWSACFIGAMGFAAKAIDVKLPADTAVDAEVDLCLTAGEFSLQESLTVSLPGIDSVTAKSIITTAYETCPYSKATRGNINVTINIL